MRQTRLNYRIYLKDSKFKGLHEFIHQFFENFIFFRWMFFKNRPRSTFLLIRSFMVTAIFCGLYYSFISKFKFLMMGVDVDPILIFSFIGVIGYWYMVKAFYEKNNYCSNLYNEIVKEKSRGHKNSAKILSLNLSAQLLAMDLWSHRIYSPGFVKNLEDAILFCYSEENQYFKPSYANADECIDAANSKQLEVGVARSILLSLQYSLEDKISA